MIEINKLTFSHINNYDFSLGPIDFMVKQHLIVSGENGSGKTTLLKCLAQILKFKKGHIKKKHTKVLYMNALSLLPWNYLTGLEYIQLYNRYNNNVISKKNVETYLAKQKIKHINFLNKKCYTYSSGQIKITKALCALLSKSDLLIFDEPDSHLDSKNSRLLYDLFSSVKDRTIVFSSHHEKLKLPQFQNIKLNNGQQIHV